MTFCHDIHALPYFLSPLRFNAIPFTKNYFFTCSSTGDKLNKHFAAVFVSLQHPNPHHHHLHQFCHRGTPHQNHRKQCGNQRGGMVWAVSLQLLLMSCNLEQQEAMPAQGNCCCLVHSLANRGGGIRSSVLISQEQRKQRETVLETTFMSFL